MIEEISIEKGISFKKEDFIKEQENHKVLSQTAAKGKFKSGLADNSEKTKNCTLQHIYS
jgi:hypothetical protein